ncbi:MAG: tail fiber domain-containing protein, partial [Paracoccaceae bacterium]
NHVYSILDVEGSNGGFGGQLYVSSTEDFAENNGGGILFGAKVSASNRALTGSIHGVKSNDTDGDYKGDLVFTTRSGQTGTTNDIFQNESIMPERMRIRHDGNVGIGTNNPNEMLHVKGHARIEGLGDSAILLFGDAVGAPNHRYIAGDISGNILIRPSDTSYIGFMGGGQEKMRISPEGRVGIGITNPDSPLHVQGNFKASHDTTNATIMGNFLSASGKVSSQLRMWNEDDEINVSISNDTDSYFKGGNVGIGTTSPSKTLDVDGDINFSGNIYQNGSAVSFDTAAGGGGGGSSPWTVDGSAIGYAGTVRTQNLEIDGGVQLDNGGGTKGIWFGETSAARGYIGAGVFAINAISSSDFGISSGLGGNLVLGIAGTEKMRIDAQINTVKFLTDVEVGGELFLGPYADSAGETSSTQNKLYNISCSPFDWPDSPNPDILSQISMGCENTSQDDGVILFKTAANENQSSTVPTTGGSGDATPRNHNLVEAMRITPQGNVGIGTANPSDKLEVAGNIVAQYIGCNTDAGFSAAFSKTNNAPAIKFKGINSGVGLNYSFGIDAIDGDSNKFSINRTNDADQFVTNLLTIESSGNVGIGTSAPECPLMIQANPAGDSMLKLIDERAYVEGEERSAISFQGKDSNGLRAAIGGIEAYGASSGRGGLRFLSRPETSSTAVGMVLNEDGNVGVGTTSPGFGKLVVAGQWDGSGSDGVTLEFNSTTEKSVIESYCRPGEGTGANAGFVGSKALEFSASEYTFIGAGVAKQHVWAKADGLPGDAGLEGAYTSYGVKTFSDTAPDYSCGVGLDTTLTGSPSFKIGFAKDSFARPIDGTLFSIRPETLPGDAKSLIQLGNFMSEFGMAEPQQQLQLTYKSGLSLFAVGGTSAQSADNQPAWIRSFTYELPDYTSTSVYAEGNSKQGNGNPENVNLRTAGVGVYKNGANAQAHGYHWHTDQDGAGHYYWTSTGGHLKYSTQGNHIGTDSGQAVGDQTSDERLKDIKTDFKYGLEQVLQLKPIEYSFKPEGDSQNRLGFGAQSTQDIIPEAVYDTGECIDGYDEGEKQEGQQLPQQTAKSEDTKLGMQYAQLIPVLTKAIQELKAENDDLKSRLESIEQWRGNSV